MKTTLPICLGLFTLVLSPIIIAHDDDPKARNRVAPYAGTGFLRGGRASQPMLHATGPNGSVGPGTSSMPVVGQGVQLLSWLTLSDLGASSGVLANDCWGYVSPSGREYAAIGTEEATIFIEVTDPFAPNIVGNIPGPSGIWRDVKIYQEYAYSVCESGCGGVQVIDLSQIDQGTVTLVNTASDGSTGSSHNVFVNEESGFLYRVGGGGLGLRFYSLANPLAPAFVGQWNDRYVHDVQVVSYTSGPYAGKEVAFCGSGFNSGWGSPGVTIVDVTNKANPVLLGEIQYPGAVYSHQGWLTEDRQYFLLGDELDEGSLGIPSTTHVIDVSDLSNPTLAGTFTNGLASVTHNGYVKGDLFFQANYSSGLRIFDISDPVNGNEVAWFDTYPANDDVSYNGMWSVYPYLPSGVIIASDRQNGLFILWHGEDRIGSTYCAPGVANSSGQPGRMQATGSSDVASNNVTLSALTLATNQFGYFITSQDAGLFPNPGGSQGTLCLGGSIGRYNGQVQTSGPDGSFAITIDVNQMPVNPVTAAVAGETWRFQAWYRDNNPGTTSNFTDAVEITFQ